MKRRIALLLCSDRALSTFPSVCNAAHLLLAAGYEVDLYLPQSMCVDCEIAGLHIRRFAPHRVPVVGIFRTLVTRISRYHLLMPFHRSDFLVAAALGKILRIPCIYFCLEISAGDPVRTVRSRVRKRVETALIRNSALLITQDESRKTLAETEYGLAAERICCVPNSYLGAVRTRSRYFRERFSIPDDRQIVLYAGGIERWALDEKLVKSVAGWSRNLVLVLHGWSRDGYLQELRRWIDEVNAAETKVYLSLDSLSTEDYMQAVSSADVGLAWYRRTSDLNVHQVGLSSGKLAAFLRCGVPVVVPSYLPVLPAVVRRHALGRAAHGEDEIGGCVEEILADRSRFSANAHRFYDEHLDFQKGFQSVMKHMDFLLQARPCG